MNLLAKSIQCFYVVLTQCCSGLELFDITGRDNSTGFPISDRVNAKFTVKDNILPAHQWLKTIWLSPWACFAKNRVTFKEGTASGLAATAFLGHPRRFVLWFAEGLGRKARGQGLCWLPELRKALDKLGSPSGLGRSPEGGELVLEKIPSIALEVCGIHAQRNPLSNAYCRTPWRCLPVG